MRTLAEYITESILDEPEFKELGKNRIVKKVNDLFNKTKYYSSFYKNDRGRDKYHKLMTAIAADSSWAEAILKGKFPVMTPDDRYGFCEIVNYKGDEILFSSVKNDYMKYPEYKIKYFGKYIGFDSAHSSKKPAEAKQECKIQAIMYGYNISEFN